MKIVCLFFCLVFRIADDLLPPKLDCGRFWSRASHSQSGNLMTRLIRKYIFQPIEKLQINFIVAIKKLISKSICSLMGEKICLQTISAKKEEKKKKI